MATLVTYPFTTEELTDFANFIKDHIAYNLYNDGVIDDPAVIGENYAVVITRPGFLGKMLAKIRGEDLENKDTLNIAVLKTIPNREKEVTGNVEESEKTDEVAAD